MHRFRSLLATAVLLAFPVLALALIGLLVWMVAQQFSDDSSWILQLGAVLLASLVAAIAFAIRDVRRMRPEPAEGPELTRAEHPRLWAEIDSLASRIGVTAPSRAVLVPDATAAVADLDGEHELVLGVPLLATFTVPELRSVLAHEFGHIAGGDTTQLARAMRWRALIVTAWERAHFPVSLLLGLYARVAHAVTAAADREVETVADRFSAEVAGPTVAARALRRIAAVEPAWDLVVTELLPLTSPAGVRAPAVDALDDVLAGAGGKLDDAVAELLADRRVDWTASHPPIGTRVAVFESMASGAPRAAGATRAAGVPDTPSLEPPAHSLLTGGRQWLVDREGEMLVQDLPVVDSWDAVVRRGIATDLLRTARAVTADLVRDGLAPTGTYAAALDAIAAQPRKFDEELLALLGEAALVDSDLLEHRIDWENGFVATAPDGAVVRIEETVASVSPESVAALRSLLLDRGADLDRTPGEGRILTDRGLAGVLTHVKVARGEVVHALVFGHGVLLVPSQAARLDKAFGQKQLDELERVERLALQPAGQLQALPGARWIAAEEVADFRFVGVVKVPELTLADGSNLRLKLTEDTEGIEEAYPALLRLAGQAKPNTGGNATTTIPAQTA